MHNNTLPTTSAALRPVDDSPALAALAADLLRTPAAMLKLGADEARCVVAHMRLASFGVGSTLFRQGDGSATSYMLLLLEGQISVDISGPGATDAVAVSVLGPGAIVGEMALFDGAPRSANCVAVTPVLAAGLSRKGLEMLVDQHPPVGAKLLLALGQRLADRLRAVGQQVQIYGQLGAARLQNDFSADRPSA